MSTLINLLTAIEEMNGTRDNANNLIEEFGGEERAVKVLANSYCQLCRIHGKRISMVGGAEDLIQQNIADYNKASAWD